MARSLLTCDVYSIIFSWQAGTRAGMAFLAQHRCLPMFTVIFQW